ncbi:MAG: hypothetical protein B6U94_00560 [Thermofilum sp. ex4484_79]|nr:MAG: hypothetical protein B6U94_00560 [Thermofilum sp. ex4484_79]
MEFSWSYTIDDISIEAVFKRVKDGMILLRFTISPLYPYEAEILKDFIYSQLEWSYMKKQNSVVFVPREAELHFESTDEFLFKILDALLLLRPEIAQAFSLKSIGENLLRNDWLVWVENDILEARKILSKKGGRIHVEFTKKSRYSCNGKLTIRYHPISFEDAKKLLLELRKTLTGYECMTVSLYPILDIECEVKGLLCCKIKKFLNNIVKKWKVD